MLHMKACLLTPDVQLSSPTLPFGPVQTGKCKVPSSPSLNSPRPSSLSSHCLLTVLSCCLLACWYQKNPFCVCSQVMMVLMHNTREVPAEWQVKPPADAAAAAEWSHFKCEPEQGLLPPGQKQLLKVHHMSVTTCLQSASLCHMPCSSVVLLTDAAQSCASVVPHLGGQRTACAQTATASSVVWRDLTIAIGQKAHTFCFGAAVLAITMYA